MVTSQFVARAEPAATAPSAPHAAIAGDLITLRNMTLP